MTGFTQIEEQIADLRNQDIMNVSFNACEDAADTMQSLLDVAKAAEDWTKCPARPELKYRKLIDALAKLKE